ncbi:histone deacetylase 5 isoform X3 [Apium graveolens]|uniref:histone deacetylase 5 isoform X3 n=1 Tax=Apium graveolens TaxID=4045 RepID=UPI003D79154C
MESSESEKSESGSGVQNGRRVGLIYDDRMCKHFCPRQNDFHPENPIRIRSIWDMLQSAGIHNRCVIVDAKEADDKYLALVHTKKHIDLIKNISSQKSCSQRNRIASRFNSIYFNEGSSEAAYLAAGSVIEVAEKVAKGELDSAFAIVRPPGHHAEQHQPMGFCLYNNVGIATRFLLDERPELGIKKILIVDWDVHHGNGTQKMFWKDPRVLFFSVHRHDFGSFYPAGDDGSHNMTGEGPGAGYNINVPWENAQCGDADYLAVWDHILIPVAKEFSPDLVIVSAGFDAAINDPLGGCCVTPSGFSVMLKKLMEFAGGRIVMALEGGYNPVSIANSVLACVKVLLEDKNRSETSKNCPFDSTWQVIRLVREELCPYWPILAEKLPEKLNSRKAPQIQYHGSDSEEEYDDDDLHRVESEENEKVVEDVIEPLLKLKVDEQIRDNVSSASPPWRSKLSKVDVWYATFGSNMSRSRFLCYIEGGQTEGMRKKCSGSMDKSQPKETVWKTVPHRLFFGHDCTSTWGPGGVAFLHPESTEGDETHMCLYKITLEQFNDVLLQENTSSIDATSPLFDMSDLHSVTDKQFISVEALKTGWYHNVVYLGKEKDIPILTMTCPVSDIESFRTGKLPLCQPCEGYANTLVKGLTESKRLSKDAAISYIKEAYSKTL